MATSIKTQHQRDREVLQALLVALSTGVLAEGIVAFSGATARFQAFGRLLLVGAAALGVGGLFGFLFGIPRWLQHDPTAPPARRRGSARIAYNPNTNLEQISDWLTKILVGIGLTQLAHIPGALNDLSKYVADALPPPSAAPVAGAILIFFSVDGFLIAYLWTRLYLARELRKADSTEIEVQIEKVLDRDANAFSLVNAQLYPDPEAPEPDPAELESAIIAASPAMKAQIFHLARTVRRDNWKTDTRKMERTIPIFRALIEADEQERFHRSHGQLGYALKDSTPPGCEEAIKELTRAIEIRDRQNQKGYRIYEANRAWCRIMLADAKNPGLPTVAAEQAEIVADLKAGVSSEVGERIRTDPVVVAWLDRNGFKPDLSPK
ncbi:MAG: hypothetical protein ACJ8J0_14465 [Longimicrobiaceae bacterium]